MINIFEDGEMKPINSYAFQPGTFVAPLAENANHANTANVAAKVTDKATTESGNKVANYNTPGWFVESKVVNANSYGGVDINIGSPGTYIFTGSLEESWGEDIITLLEAKWIDKSGTKRVLTQRGTAKSGGGNTITAPIETKDGIITLTTYNYSPSNHTFGFNATWLKLGDL